MKLESLQQPIGRHELPDIFKRVSRGLGANGEVTFVGIERRLLIELV
jgi:hypothetical protein